MNGEPLMPTPAEGSPLVLRAGQIVLADWRQGRYIHFNGLSQWLAWVWPYAALGWLASAAERAYLARRRGGDGSGGSDRHRSL